MNLPNALTLLRIFFVPLLVAALVQENFEFQAGNILIGHEMLALGIFLTAAATDLLDGYLARRWSQVTTVGTLLDPIADKLLISAALVSLVQVHALPGWMAILIIGREFAISGLRSIAAAEGYVIKASELGKTKLVFQVFAIALVMLALRWPEWTRAATGAMWLVYEAAGADMTGTNGAGATVQSVEERRTGGANTSVSFAFPSAVNSGNGTLAVVGITANATITPGTGWTTVGGTTTYTGPNQAFIAMHANTAVQTVAASWSACPASWWPPPAPCPPKWCAGRRGAPDRL